MKWLGLHTRMRALVGAAFPSLRVIGMAYTGLIGIGATALVVSVAFLPVAPVLQQATQPARDAVAQLVQPAAEVVTGLITTWPAPAEPRILVMDIPPPQVALPSPLAIEIMVPDEAPALSADVQGADVQPVAARVVTAPVAQLTLAPVAKLSVSRAASAEASQPVAETVPADEPQPEVATNDRAIVRTVPVEALAPILVQQEANLDVPQPLPALPSPTATEAAWQAKARLDAENQAAIDTAKVLLVRRKADADTANQAAIDARRAATDVPPTSTALATPVTARPLPAVSQTRPPTATPLPPTATAATARLPRSKVTPPPIPTLRPVPSTPTPVPTPMADPTPTGAVVKATVNVDPLSDQPADVEEMPVTLALDKASDVSR